MLTVVCRVAVSDDYAAMIVQGALEEALEELKAAGGAQAIEGYGVVVEVPELPEG